ncbi:MazG nucleotide pyrophosphohydrolase [Pyrolobus fumarii 1A]|uniref:MazG nucleotide pyrophosphohydrolase n=1 Tax=Pyrolobus fumarii (strain DSM 11204 / 1A) TaxID=694429 RepID=G0ECV0_PYRF1|nr:nucleoside triphosphate pyrophosphohydrolase [Pyrolobus fumarii]AEM39670.1 MazG nucleotide pyrophosphohydrolase [Pyrolobus fumarii 1A]
MCWKLVRDKIGEELRSRGVTVWKARSNEEYVNALRAKIIEEAYELAVAESSESVLEEAADLLEAIVSLLKLHGYTLEDLLARAEAKRRERGGFEKRLIALLEDC